MSAQPPTAVSPAGSLKGFSWKTLLVNNKTLVKVFVAALAGYAASLPALVHDPSLNALAAAGVGLLVKFAADAVDFWLTDVPIPVPGPGIAK